MKIMERVDRLLCKFGFHDWGLSYSSRMSDTIGWVGTAKDCQRDSCGCYSWSMNTYD